MGLDRRMMAQRFCLQEEMLGLDRRMMAQRFCLQGETMGVWKVR